MFRCHVSTEVRAFLLLAGIAWFVPSVSRAEDKPLSIKAAKLAETYATDPAAFNKTYKDKVVEVEGVVEVPSAEDTIAKKSYVMIHGFKKKGDPVETMVRCEISKGLEGLKAGQTVRIKGTCQEHSDTRFAAELVECKLVK